MYKYIIGYLILAGRDRVKKWYVAIEEEGEGYRNIKTTYLHRDGSVWDVCGEHGFFDSRDLAELALEKYKIKNVGINLMSEDDFIIK